MVKKLLIVGIIYALTAVVLGALGAHVLEKYLTIDQLKSFETGVRYQMYHALALILLASIPLISDKTKKVVFYLFTIGVILFSISIYLLTTTNLWNIDFSFLGPVTPIGGLLLISGWIVLLWKIISNNSVNR
ncbi:hypothetical protein JCM19275_2394 [Nonlabens ulvanivorans]|uniref:DUF423 domain-containing protein n=1 Tax=Nonlabens ulvanivorans TaxID=906888 RepID=A0A081DCS2_NONUL|nr:DUF423 domain-containing protein [Nonlabens ulvanivorans]GAK76718.1 hypothetical protein JCM19296_2318 [Nonlabens ulvanivorans]GAL73547.1 hypothetical protein JCM19275_2394 [Nonlabens ulvanivorans]